MDQLNLANIEKNIWFDRVRIYTASGAHREFFSINHILDSKH